jgi:hypothetical protein
MNVANKFRHLPHFDKRDPTVLHSLESVNFFEQSMSLANLYHCLLLYCWCRIFNIQKWKFKFVQSFLSATSSF